MILKAKVTAWESSFWSNPEYASEWKYRLEIDNGGVIVIEGGCQGLEYGDEVEINIQVKKI